MRNYQIIHFLERMVSGSIFQVIGKAGIELHTRLHLLQNFLLLLFRLLQLLSYEMGIDDPGYTHNQEGKIEQLAPDGEIPWWKNGDFELINFIADISLTIHHMYGEMIIAIRQSIVSDVKIALVQIMPLVVATLQTVGIDGGRMIGKRQIRQLEREVVLIMLQNKRLQSHGRDTRCSLNVLIEQGILGLSAIHHDTRQEQLRLVVLRHGKVGTDGDEAIITSHHHFMIQLGIIDIVRTLHRNEESETVVLRIQHAAGIACHHPDLVCHIAHGDHLPTDLPFLAFQFLALHRQVHHKALHAGIVSYPHIAIVRFHQIIDGISARDMGDAKGTGIDTVEMIIR